MKILIRRLIDQLRDVPMLAALSLIISAMYSQTIGPEENSKNEINNRTQIIIPVEFLSSEKNDNAKSVIDIAALPVSNKHFLPKYIKRIRPIIEVKKLMIPIRAVISVLVKLRPLNIIFE